MATGPAFGPTDPREREIAMVVGRLAHDEVIAGIPLFF